MSANMMLVPVMPAWLAALQCLVTLAVLTMVVLYLLGKIKCESLVRVALWLNGILAIVVVLWYVTMVQPPTN